MLNPPPRRNGGAAFRLDVSRRRQGAADASTTIRRKSSTATSAGSRAIDVAEQELTVDFDGRQVVYDFGELDELSLAYALTIHKAQGSEYPAVVIPLHTQHYLMLQRNLLYTGITRGKKLVVLVGSARPWRWPSNGRYGPAIRRCAAPTIAMPLAA